MLHQSTSGLSWFEVALVVYFLATSAFILIGLLESAARAKFRARIAKHDFNGVFGFCVFFICAYLWLPLLLMEMVVPGFWEVLRMLMFRQPERAPSLALRRST